MSAATRKVRVLFCGGVVPMREWHAASPLLWRHFAALGGDFELCCVLPAMAKDSGVDCDFACSFFSQDPWWLKYRRYSPLAFRLLTRTRVHQLEREMDGLVRLFRPDLILGVWIPDDLLWLSSQLQRKLRIPRALFLHDVHGTGHFSRAAARVSKMMIRDLQSVDCGLAVSEGMREFAAEHGCRDSKLLYPVPETFGSASQRAIQDRLKPVAVYFGSLNGSYVPPLTCLAEALDAARWDFAVTWLGDQSVRQQVEKIRPVHDLGWFKIEGLPSLAEQTDVFVAVQSFEERDRLTTSVNFQSKFTQIAQFGKAVLVVAPSWSSISRWAKEKQANLGRPVVELVEDCSHASIKAALARLENDAYRAEIGTALREAFLADFDPAQLQGQLEDSLRKLAKDGVA